MIELPTTPKTNPPRTAKECYLDQRGGTSASGVPARVRGKSDGFRREWPRTTLREPRRRPRRRVGRHVTDESARRIDPPAARPALRRGDPEGDVARLEAVL